MIQELQKLIDICLVTKHAPSDCPPTYITNFCNISFKRLFAKAKRGNKRKHVIILECLKIWQQAICTDKVP